MITLRGGFEDGLIHHRIATRLGEPEIADRAVPLDGDFEHTGEVVAVLGRDGCGLLPLTVESVVDKRVVGVDGARIGTIPAGPASTRSAPLGIQEGVLRVGVPLPFAFARRGLLTVAGFFRAAVALLLSSFLFGLLLGIRL